MEKVLDEYRSAVIIAIFASFFYFVILSFGSKTLTFFSPAIFILLHYSWTRTYSWIIAILQIVATFFVFILGFQLIIQKCIVIPIESEGITGFFDHLTFFSYLIPLLHFVSFLVIVPTIKLILDRLIKFTGTKTIE